MKTIPSGLLAIYTGSGSATLCGCLRIERTDGTIERFTSADRNVTISTLGAPYDGVYLAAVGLGISSLVVQATLGVDNMDITVLPDEVSYPQVDIISGLWDNAKFRLFECSWADTTLGVNLLKRGTTGNADTLRSTRKFEFRGLKQALQQAQGRVTMKTCPYRLGSTSLPEGLCKVNLAPFTFDHTVTSVTSRHVFTCSGASEASDFYGEGTVTCLTGDNAGHRRKVKSFAAGQFTLSLELPFIVQIGDTFRCVAGCRKRHSRTTANPSGVSDCLDKFNNVLNFGGEPHVPGADLLTADPVISG